MQRYVLTHCADTLGHKDGEAGVGAQRREGTAYSVIIALSESG